MTGLGLSGAEDHAPAPDTLFVDGHVERLAYKLYMSQYAWTGQWWDLN